MTIRTERLILRPFCKSDIKWYYDLVQDDELKRWLTGLATESFKRAAADVAIFQNGDFENDFYFVIEDKLGNVVGIIVAVKITNMTIDVSYYLKNEYRGRGYMNEALVCLMTEARSKNPVYRFRFVIDEDNTPSLNVVKRFNVMVQKEHNDYICFI